MLSISIQFNFRRSHKFMKYNQQEKDNRPIDTELKNNSEGWDPEASKKFKNRKTQKQNYYYY